MIETTRGPLGRSIDSLYGIYALLQFGLLCLLALIAVTVVPGAGRRSRIVSAIIRTSFRLAGIEPRISGIGNLPDRSCVLVANHASYLDGLLLKGFLPGNFAFVIKGEMRGIPIVHFLLRRSGSRFVERFEAAASARDEILPAITPDDPAFSDKPSLAETARQRIIATLGEPDLLQAPT